MGIFGPEKYVGVDIGTSRLKLVELAAEGERFDLLTYGSMILPTDINRDESDRARQELARLLGKLMEGAGVTTKKAVAALPGFWVTSFVMPLDKKTSRRHIAKEVFVATEQQLPYPLEKAVVDWRYIHTTADKKNPTHVLVTAAPKDRVRHMIDLFRQVGIKLIGLETESFALVRSLIGSDNEPVLIINVGATTTDVIVAAFGYPVLSRSVLLGSHALTDHFWRTLSISRDICEQIKRDLAPFATCVVPTEAVLQPLFEALDDSLSFYEKKFYHKPKKVILTGGGSRWTSLVPVLEDRFGLEVFVGDPWAKVSHEQPLKERLNGLAPDYAVAVGLAMRGE